MWICSYGFIGRFCGRLRLVSRIECLDCLVSGWWRK
jgi:hypothetical protein